jgi:site-specific recombinase XerD
VPSLDGRGVSDQVHRARPRLICFEPDGAITCECTAHIHHPHTISSYRDTFRQFLKLIQQLRTPPSHLGFEEIDAPLIVAFSDELEKDQGLSLRSRNLRLTAFHSFFRYAAFDTPAHSAQIQRVLAIPMFVSP